MKMVSAAKLRRAQERAMQARPYAQMLLNILESLVRRTDLYNDETGDVMHPLLIEREEKNVLVIVIAGDKGFAGGFNSNVGKAAQKFIDARFARGQNIDLEPIGKKAIGFYKRRFETAKYDKTEEHYDNDLSTHYETIRRRAAQIEVAAEHPDLLLRSNFEDVAAMARSIIERYERSEIDAVYMVYNEFKSVLSQRIVVEKLLPIRRLGQHEIESAEERTAEGARRSRQSRRVRRDQRQRAGHERVRGRGEEVRHRRGRLYCRPVAPGSIRPSAAALCHDADLSRAAGIDRCRARRAHDGDRCGPPRTRGDLIDSLSLTMNRVRQAAITKEIIEIVSGAAAL